MKKQEFYHDSYVGRNDLSDVDRCVYLTLHQNPPPPYSVRVVFKYGTYVDMIAEVNSDAEDLIEQARSELLSAFNNGQFEPADSPERNEDDEEEYHEELTVTDDPFGSESSEEDPLESGEASDHLTLFYIKKDALDPEAIGIRVNDDENGYLYWMDEWENGSEDESHKDVNTAEECIRLASVYAPLCEGDVRVIFTHGTFVDLTKPRYSESDRQAVIEEAISYLEEDSQYSEHESLELTDDRNKFNDVLCFLYQSIEFGCMNGVFNLFWQPGNKYVHRDIIDLRNADCAEKKIAKILTAKDFPD